MVPTDAPLLSATPTPRPTREPFACPTPATGDERPFTTLPEPEGRPVLARVLSRLPASFRDQGIWFADYQGAIELVGAPNPSSVEELLVLSDAEREEYLAARQGLIFRSDMLQRSSQYSEAWNDAFGFDSPAASRMVSAGSDPSSPFGTTYLELKFDTADIRQHLLDRGYQECVEAGGIYYAIRHDREQDIRDPVGRIASSTMNRLVLGNSWMVASPDTAPVVSFLEVAAGADVLLDDPAIASVAPELDNSLSAAFLTRELALPEEDSQVIDSEPPVGRPKPEHWGQLHHWEYLGAGFGVADGQPWWKFVLSYPDPGVAAADVDELSRRWEEYQLYEWQTRREPMPLAAVCPPAKFTSENGQGRSVLTVECDLPGRSSALWEVLRTRDVGFLLP